MSVTFTENADVETLWVVRDRIRINGALGNSGIHSLEVDIPAGSGTPPHRHASAELFRVVEGEVTFTVFDQAPPRAAVAGPGDVVSIAGWVGHNYVNTGSSAARMSVLLDATMVAFFRDAGQKEEPAAAPPSEAEIDRIIATCARHGVEMLAAAPA